MVQVQVDPVDDEGLQAGNPPFGYSGRHEFSDFLEELYNLVGGLAHSVDDAVEGVVDGVYAAADDSCN